MLETGGMDFNDQISKTFFGNAFIYEMYKKFIGFFIPPIYTVYYIRLHGVNNQFEVLRSKDGTMTTVIRITRSFSHGRLYHERRYGKGIYHYQSIYENGEKENKMGLSGHHKRKKRKRNMFSLWYYWPQGI